MIYFLKQTIAVKTFFCLFRKYIICIFHPIRHVLRLSIRCTFYMFDWYSRLPIVLQITTYYLCDDNPVLMISSDTSLVKQYWSVNNKVTLVISYQRNTMQFLRWLRYMWHCQFVISGPSSLFSFPKTKSIYISLLAVGLYIVTYIVVLALVRSMFIWYLWSEIAKNVTMFKVTYLIPEVVVAQRSR